MYKMLKTWMKLLVNIWRDTETKADNRWTIPTRIESMVLLSASTIWVSLSHRQAGDNAIRANSLGTWFFSKEYLCGQYGTSFINYPVQNRGEREWLPTCGADPLPLLRLTLLSGNYTDFKVRVPPWTRTLSPRRGIPVRVQDTKVHTNSRDLFDLLWGASLYKVQDTKMHP